MSGRIMEEESNNRNSKIIKTILIAEEDLDDQFIFKTAITELDPEINVHFFFTSQLLIQYLVKVTISGHEELMPDLIVGDMKAPFFDLKDIAEIRTYKQFQNIPVYVFADSYTDVTLATAMALGATEFFHKPNSLHRLKVIFEGILNKKPQVSV